MQALKRFAVTIAGAVLLLLGLAMMLLPGPGILFLVAGFAVLATEYVWARALLDQARKKAQVVQQAAVASPLRTAGSLALALGLCGLALAMLLVDDLSWPVLDDRLDQVWGPVTGGVVLVTGLVLLTTTVLTVRLARGEPTTLVLPTMTGGATAWRLSGGATRWRRGHDGTGSDG